MVIGSCSDDASWPILICLLGNFRLLAAGELVPIRAGGKREALLAHLALQFDRRVSRERLAQALWPKSDPVLAFQSLNNLVYTLHKLLGPALQRAAPVLHEDGYYRLNVEAGIGVDVARFDHLLDIAHRQMQAGDTPAALTTFHRAAELYRDDLYQPAGGRIIVERERLRTRYLTLLAHLAEQYYQKGGYQTCLEYLWRLLARDPGREDAHRLLMRCFVRRGERAAALRQYQVCADLLRTEFNAEPEPATLALFEQIRDRPHTL